MPKDRQEAREARSEAAEPSAAKTGLTEAGVRSMQGAPEAEGRVHQDARAPVSPDDNMTLDARLLSTDTKKELKARGLTRDAVLTDHNRAEEYAAQIFQREGIPNGSGTTDKTKGDVVSGHYERRGEGGVGIDLVAADEDGAPIPIEVKKYHQASAAHLENRPVSELEPEVVRWKREREGRVHHRRQGQEVRVDKKEFDGVPSVERWQRQMDRDAARMKLNRDEIPVQQMDDLWTRDRWLKVIKHPEGKERMRRAGVAERYLDHDRMSSSPTLEEWQHILDRRTTVIISDSEGDTGKKLFDQSVGEKRSYSVTKIKL